MISITAGSAGDLKLTRSIERKDFGTTDAYSDNAGWTSLFGGPYGHSHTGLEINPVTALQSGVAYSCVRILCGDVSKLPLRLMKRTDDDIWREDRKHRLSRLVRRPNKRMTQADMTAQWVISMLLAGNAYTAVLRSDDGHPNELVPLLPTTVSVREDGIGNLFYYVLNRLFANRHDNLFSEEDMVHTRSIISMDNGIRGMSPVQLCSEVLGLSLATQQLSASMFRSGAHFHGFLTTPNPMTREALQDISEQWSKNNSGLHNSYKTPVLGNNFDFKPTNMNAEQAQLIQARASVISEVAMLFGVPLYKLGGVEKGSSFNSIDAQAQDYIDSTLIPITNPIEQSLNRTLLFDREYDDYRFEFDFTALEKGDLKTRSEFYHSMLTDGVFSVNEVRKGFNLATIGDEGDIRTKPLNTGIVGQTEAMPTYQVDGPLKETETTEAPAAAKRKAVRSK